MQIHSTFVDQSERSYKAYKGTVTVVTCDHQWRYLSNSSSRKRELTLSNSKKLPGRMSGSLEVDWSELAIKADNQNATRTAGVIDVFILSGVELVKTLLLG